jgi:glutathione S-transferase
MILVIGNKTYSSWSLRPWVLMKHFGIPFEEKLVKLDRPDTAQQIAQYSRAGKVPILVDGDLRIWDSLAIMEYVNEKFPGKNMWPKEIRARARARAISCEMHSGFQTMRSVMSHHLKKTFSDFNWSSAESDVNRVKDIWRTALRDSPGPFLFGDFSIADAMYAPVVNRFITYGIPIEANIKGYVEAIRNLPAHQAWINDAIHEDFKVPRYEISASA